MGFELHNFSKANVTCHSTNLIAYKVVEFMADLKHKLQVIKEYVDLNCSQYFF